MGNTAIMCWQLAAASTISTHAQCHTLVIQAESEACVQAVCITSGSLVLSVEDATSCMIVKPVKLVGRMEMRKTDCFGKTRLVLHVPSSS